jgi:hypothetical protein
MLGTDRNSGGLVSGRPTYANGHPSDDSANEIPGFSRRRLCLVLAEPPNRGILLWPEVSEGVPGKEDGDEVETDVEVAKDGEENPVSQPLLRSRSITFVAYTRQERLPPSHMGLWLYFPSRDRFLLPGL